MENLILKSSHKIQSAPRDFYRYLLKRINLKNRLIAILGARGVGKTTLLLQLAQQSKKETLYVALDDLFFTDNSLYSLAENFQLAGGELLLLDEVHKYPNWSREVKLIYDDFPDIQLIITSSSILDIYKAESDLSRRAIHYQMHEMSFREYLEFKHKIKLQAYSLEEILSRHEEIARKIRAEIKPVKYYNEYIKWGAYPYYDGDENDYYQRIQNTINLILDIDMQSIEGLSYPQIAKIKRLLFVLANNVPFTPNISKLAEKIELHRNNLVLALQLLEKAALIRGISKKGKSISILSKPDKMWLHNTNLSYAIAENTPDIGNLRETYFLQHLIDHKMALSDKADFLVDNKYTFEIGGKSKNLKQISGLSDAFVVKDNIEIGAKNIIPLWMFGLLY